MGLCFPKSNEIGTKHDLPTSTFISILVHHNITILNILQMNQLTT